MLRIIDMMHACFTTPATCRAVLKIVCQPVSLLDIRPRGFLLSCKFSADLGSIHICFCGVTIEGQRSFTTPATPPPPPLFQLLQKE